jgi:hypothetical protein
VRRRAEQAGRAEDAERRQDAGRLRDAADRVDRRVEPAVEQDEGERHRAEPERRPVVVEGDPADPLRPREHADDQEHQRHRHREALRRAAEHHAHGQQQPEGRQEDGGGVRLGHRMHVANLTLPVPWQERET